MEFLKKLLFLLLDILCPYGALTKTDQGGFIGSRKKLIYGCIVGEDVVGWSVAGFRIHYIIPAQ